MKLIRQREDRIYQNIIGRKSVTTLVKDGIDIKELKNDLLYDIIKLPDNQYCLNIIQNPLKNPNEHNFNLSPHKRLKNLLVSARKNNIQLFTKIQK